MHTLFEATVTLCTLSYSLSTLSYSLYTVNSIPTTLQLSIYKHDLSPRQPCAHMRSASLE